MPRFEETVDWDALGGATRSCAHVPRALDRLFAKDQATRDAAYWELDNHVVVQGDLYEGAAFVARAVVERLATRPTSSPEAYVLLTELALGAAPDDETVVIDGAEVPLKEATNRALALGLESYTADLQSSIPSIRCEVARLLFALGDVVRVQETVVRARLEGETDDDVKLALQELLEEY